jgi:hypothetical protein
VEDYGENELTPLTPDFEGKLQIYPNPTQGSVNIFLSNWDTYGPVRVDLLSLTGQNVLATAWIKLSDRGSKTLQIDSLSSGMYILKVHSQNQSGQFKIIKQ